MGEAPARSMSAAAGFSWHGLGSTHGAMRIGLKTTPSLIINRPKMASEYMLVSPFAASTLLCRHPVARILPRSSPTGGMTDKREAEPLQRPGPRKELYDLCSPISITCPFALSKRAAAKATWIRTSCSSVKASAWRLLESHQQGQQIRDLVAANT
jgi:hypothetical protein